MKLTYSEAVDFLNTLDKTPLQEWYYERAVEDNMIWKECYKSQLMFVRDNLNGLVNAGIDYKEITSVQVISTHCSKSIELPVYLLQRGELFIVLRNNFYNWKMSVINPDFILSDFSTIFHTTSPVETGYTGNPLADCYFEGFPKELVFGYYHESNKDVWSAEIHGDYTMYMTLFKMMEAKRFIKPLEWSAREKNKPFSRRK